jgi:hypothetical protein|nr:MAG TPA: AntA/AntB antirepressor [Caudoviricetes sp.]
MIMDQLTKSSTSEEIKEYFNAILALKEKNELYPVNIDDVWPLVYSERGKATRALKSNFIENEDYILFAQNGKNLNGRPKDDYKLSLSCFEYFIARKVRPVFEVYRQVFHKVAEQKPLSQLEILVQSAQALLEQSKRIENVEKRLDAMEQEREENGKLLLAVAVSSEKVPEISLRDKIRQLVNKYASATNTRQQDVWHKVYEQLYYLYHISISNYKKKFKGETKLEIAERNNILDKVYAIISNMVRERNVA